MVGQMLTETAARSQNTSTVNDNVCLADAPARWNRRIKLPNIDRQIDTYPDSARQFSTSGI